MPPRNTCLIDDAIALSGLTQIAFCKRVLARTDRCALYWRTGHAMPATVRSVLEWFVALSEQQRAAYLRALNASR